MRRRGFLGGTMACAAVGKGAAQTMTNLHVPGEEEPHQATFMMWPVSRRVYGDAAFLEEVQETIAQIASTIALFEPVILLAAGEDHASARAMVSAKVTLWDIPTEDLWARDAGPLFAHSDAGLVVSHLQFNGWGGKQGHRRDGQVAARVAQRLGLPLIPSGLKGEAGGVEQDGAGLLMAHESSWIIRNRNPGLSRDQVETALLRAYGAERMIWSPGLRGEDITDYHIDSLARFTGPGRVLANLPARPDPRDPFHRAAAETVRRLHDAALEVEVIPEPRQGRVTDPDFVASYANFYVGNGAVILAAFGDPDTDAEAQRALARHYPGREVVALSVDALGHLGGGIHCATQQMPTLP